MTIILYTNKSETIKLDKELVELARLNGTLRDESSVTDPVIKITDIGEYVQSVNYVWIEEFKRYYFVRGLDYVNNNMWRLSLHVDVLMTYKDQIRSQKGIIERNESQYNLKLNDGLFVTQQNPRIATFAFPKGFTRWDYILAVSGTDGPSES